MTTELKPCPFCFVDLYVESGDLPRAFHPFSGDCWVSECSWMITQEWAIGWNTRPVEDDLRAKLKIAVEALEHTPCSCYPYHRDHDSWDCASVMAKEALTKIRGCE